MHSKGNEHTWEQLQKMDLFIGGGRRERVIYAPEEVARVSGARFVCLCTTGQGKGVGRCFIDRLRG